MAWFHRYITIYDIFKGEQTVLASIEEDLTPLWIWEV
jgi:hypothetical protein